MVCVVCAYQLLLKVVHSRLVDHWRLLRRGERVAADLGLSARVILIFVTVNDLRSDGLVLTVTMVDGDHSNGVAVRQQSSVVVLTYVGLGRQLGQLSVCGSCSEAVWQLCSERWCGELTDPVGGVVCNYGCLS